MQAEKERRHSARKRLAEDCGMREARPSSEDKTFKSVFLAKHEPLLLVLKALHEINAKCRELVASLVSGGAPLAGKHFV